MKDPKKIEKAGAEFLNMISVQNALLGNNKYFTLNRWLNEAAEFGKNLPDTNIILYNAKSQLTYWGPDNNPKTDLRDYAHKEWNGLLGSLYYKRWERFINDAKAGVVTKPEEFYRMEIEWSKGKNMYVPVKTNGKKTELLQNEILK